MGTIEDFIFKSTGQQKSLIAYLHHRLIDYHDLRGKISYKIPVYDRKSLVCYINPIKGDGVELAFARGYRLSNDQEILERKNRKYVAGVSLYNVTDVPEKAIDEIVQEALILDDLTQKSKRK